MRALRSAYNSRLISIHQCVKFAPFWKFELMLLPLELVEQRVPSLRCAAVLVPDGFSAGHYPCIINECL